MPAWSRPSASKKKSPSLKESIDQLKRQAEHTVYSGLDHLTQLNQHLQIATIFNRLFPRLYRQTITQLPAVQPDELIDRLLQPFVERISRQYFPLQDWDLEWVRENIPYIPISLENFDMESEFEGIPLPEQIAATMAGMYSHAPSWEDIQGRLGPTITLPLCFLDEKHHCRITSDRFAAVCRQFPEPVRSFSILLDIARHDTGSIFLDISYDYEMNSHGFTWTRKDIHQLSKQWKTAQRLARIAHRTVNGLLRQPEQWNTIFHCWQTLCRTENRKRK